MHSPSPPLSAPSTFPPQPLYEGWFLALFNLLYSTLPVLYIGLFEQVSSSRSCLFLLCTYFFSWDCMRNKGAVRNKEISCCESQKSRHWCQRQQQLPVVVCTLCNTINTSSSDLAPTLVSDFCQALCSNSLCLL